MENAPKSTARSGPDFLCVGAQKAGTSWLYDQLRTHPDFWMPPIKALHYFEWPRDFWSTRGRKLQKNSRDSRDIRFLDALETISAKPEIDFEEYAALFEAKANLLSGDITPAYSTLQDEIIERISARFAQVRVIFLARDPVERAWSHLSMLVRHGATGAFDPGDGDAIMRNLFRSDVLLRSSPSQIVARWRRHIHPSRFRVYFFDDLKREPVKLRQSIVEFLGADPRKPSGELPANYNQKARFEKFRLTDEVRSQMAQFFESELRACADELGGVAKDWPARYGF
jgi:hypothetical protein